MTRSSCSTRRSSSALDGVQRHDQIVRKLSNSPPSWETLSSNAEFGMWGGLLGADTRVVQHAEALSSEGSESGHLPSAEAHVLCSDFLLPTLKQINTSYNMSFCCQHFMQHINLSGWKLWGKLIRTGGIREKISTTIMAVDPSLKGPSSSVQGAPHLMNFLFSKHHWLLISHESVCDWQLPKMALFQLVRSKRMEFTS